jgi:hypothetical protein
MDINKIVETANSIEFELVMGDTLKLTNIVKFFVKCFLYRVKSAKKILKIKKGVCFDITVLVYTLLKESNIPFSFKPLFIRFYDKNELLCATHSTFIAELNGRYFRIDPFVKSPKPALREGASFEELYNGIKDDFFRTRDGRIEIYSHSMDNLIGLPLSKIRKRMMEQRLE